VAVPGNYYRRWPGPAVKEGPSRRYFKPRPGTKSAVHILKTPFPDITTSDAVIRSLVLKNPLGCTSYMCAKRNHPPVEIVREMYTAKFVYVNAGKKQIGAGLDRYDSVEGYETGIASVISNMANIASHRGKVKHTPAADLFSVTLKCHDPDGECYFLSIARDRVTLSSYTDDAIRHRAETWTDSVPALA
jgi:hypothetical protein